jgi:hypothetical protein
MNCKKCGVIIQDENRSFCRLCEEEGEDYEFVQDDEEKLEGNNNLEDFNSKQNPNEKRGPITSKIKSMIKKSEDEDLFGMDGDIQKTKKRKKILKMALWGAGVVALLIVMIASDLIEGFSSPRRLYVRAERDYFFSLMDKVSDFMDDQTAERMIFSSLPYNYNASTKIQIDGFIPNAPTNYRSLLLVMNGLVYQREAAGDHQSLKYFNRMSLSKNERELVLMQYFRNQTNYEVSFPGLSEKNFQVDLTDLEGLKRKYALNSSILPNNQIRVKEYYERFDFLNQKSFGKIARKYSSIFMGLVKKHNVAMENNVPMVVDGKNVEARRFVIDFSKNEMEELFGNLFETLKRDREIFNLTKNTVLSATKDNKEWVDEFEKEFTMEVFEETIQRFSENLKRNDFYSDMKMTVFIDREGNMIRRTMEFFDIAKPNDIKNTLQIESMDGEEGAYRFISILLENIQSEILQRTEIVREDENFTEKRVVYQMNYEDPFETVIPFWPIEVQYHIKKSNDSGETSRDNTLLLTLAKGSDKELRFSAEIDSKLDYQKNIEVPEATGENSMDVNQERADLVIQELEGVISTLLFRFLLST